MFEWERIHVLHIGMALVSCRLCSWGTTKVLSERLFLIFFVFFFLFVKKAIYLQLLLKAKIL